MTPLKALLSKALLAQYSLEHPKHGGNTGDIPTTDILVEGVGITVFN